MKAKQARQVPRTISASFDLTTTGSEASPAEAASELGNGHASNSDRSPSPILIRTTERRLLLKIDCRIIPCLGILSLLCFLNLLDIWILILLVTDSNRSNLGSGMTYGLQDELHISDKQYATVLTAFFAMYIMFTIPSNIMMKRMTPRVWCKSPTNISSSANQPSDIVYFCFRFNYPLHRVHK